MKSCGIYQQLPIVGCHGREVGHLSRCGHATGEEGEGNLQTAGAVISVWLPSAQSGHRIRECANFLIRGRVVCISLYPKGLQRLVCSRTSLAALAGYFIEDFFQCGLECC